MLENILRMNELLLVESDPPNWKRIVQAQNLARVAKPSTEIGPKPGPTTVATRIFELEHATPSRVQQTLKPYTANQRSAVQPVSERNLLIVTDYAANMPRLAELIETFDRAGPKRVIEFFDLKHRRAKPLAEKVTQLLQAKRGDGDQGQSTGPAVDAHPKTNRLALIGLPAAVKQARELAQSLDVSLGLKTRTYRFRETEPSRVDQLIQQLVGKAAAAQRYQAAIDEETGMLIATTSERIHKRIAALKEELDQPAPERSRREVRFYELENAKASEVLDVIEALKGTGEGGRFQQLAVGPSPRQAAGDTDAAATAVTGDEEDQQAIGGDTPADAAPYPPQANRLDRDPRSVSDGEEATPRERPLLRDQQEPRLRGSRFRGLRSVRTKAYTKFTMVRPLARPATTAAS